MDDGTQQSTQRQDQRAAADVARGLAEVARRGVETGAEAARLAARQGTDAVRQAAEGAAGQVEQLTRQLAEARRSTAAWRSAPPRRRAR